MPTRKSWWLQNDEQAWKNRPQPRRPVPPGGVAVMFPGPRPPVGTLPNPWPPYVPPEEASESDPEIRRRKRPNKKQAFANQIVHEIDALVAAGKTRNKARSEVARKYKRRPSAVERMDRRAKKKQARK